MTYNGYFYVVDGGGNKLRKMDPAGTVTTIAGNGNFGFVDGPAATAEFNYPQDICYDKNCAIYISDLYNNRIRKLTVPEGPAGCTSGIGEVEDYDLSFYPNPNSGIISIENLKGNIVNYKVFNSLSQEVRNGTTARNAIDITALENGVYFVSIINNHITITKKIILQK